MQTPAWYDMQNIDTRIIMQYYFQENAIERTLLNT